MSYGKLKWTKQEPFFKRSDGLPRKRATAPGYIGRGIHFPQCHEIEATFHFNGSGEQAFGGAKNWPHLVLNVSFKEGEVAERNALYKKLQETVSEFFENLK